MALRVQWFTDIVTDTPGPWRGRTGEFSPTYYAHKGPDATSERLRELLVERVGRDVSVLELGCNVGRHLAHLHADGFTDLTGVDINPEAVAGLRETYPRLAASGAFIIADIVDFLAGLSENAFEVVYSVETLQHVPPGDEQAFDDAARVTAELLVTVENEGRIEGAGHERTAVADVSLYHRDWAYVFANRGLRPIAEVDADRDTLRVFQV